MEWKEKTGMSIDPAKNLMVSIIIPVYQAKDTLRECVESCVCQKNISKDEYEIILVDDGSTDGSGDLCDELSGEDYGVAIKVVHTENFGVSHARNTGIEMAQGRFLVFVDSDDKVREAYISNLLKHADESMVIVDETDSFFSVQKISGFQYIEESILNRNTHVWGKLIDRETVENGNVRFPEGLSIGEDLLFLLDLAIFVGKKRCIRCIAEGDYFYNVNESGAMLSSFKKSYLDQLTCWKEASDKLQGIKGHISPYALVNVAASQISTALLVIGKVATQQGKRDEELSSFAVSESMKQINSALKVRGAFAALEAGHKIKVIMLKISPSLYLKLYARHKG